MTIQHGLLTTFFIATTAIGTWANAENIYKCGNTYRQSPCPGGQLLTIDDSRDPEQKKRKDDITRRDTELANAMEKTRRANEDALAAQRVQADTVTAKPKRVKEAPIEPTVAHARKPRLSKPHKPEGFTAVVPGTVRKTSKSHKKLPNDTL